ncbi:hypothetical protein CLV98_111125 [Dyadobacter jejuensis]|uniref:Uncharacterized protein n=1 Tax=Dyadobacter jejuensis TaxID=1082580 RepID=A0A316AG87_9BACT|nr:hypothetical protein [Dyadobacter jejuensis]PWJ56631.1 hypothetical protein CLV98_111125 [Dyadobacter jejuensis]
MKKDIIFHPVDGIQVAIVRQYNELNQATWDVILINKKNVPISNVFVTSQGYSAPEQQRKEAKKTSTLRHFFPEIAPGGHVVVEPIMEALFHLYNQYWVSFFVDNQVYDKKFIFVPDSIVEDHMVRIPTLGLEGILHE